ncbi:MAG: hypothetical protein PHP44_02320 [Kiritimatiellae bacterium]|nr:hypothetical protein [Kiritimatiellia bacterium]
MKRKKADRGTKTVIRVALMVFALLTLLAFGYDLKYGGRQKKLPEKESLGQDLAAILLNENQREYRDPDGRFSLSVPMSWTPEHPSKQDRPYDVVFTSPYDCDLSLIVSPIGDKTFASLLHDLWGIQDQVGINMNIEEITFRDRPAIRREITLHYSKIIVIDFIQDGWAHEIQLAIPHRHVEQSSAILEMILDRYQPGPFEGSVLEKQ